MTKARSKHVVPTASGGWAVKSTGATRAAKLFTEQEQAIAYGRDLASHARTTLYVHARDGTVESRIDPPSAIVATTRTSPELRKASTPLRAGTRREPR